MDANGLGLFKLIPVISIPFFFDLAPPSCASSSSPLPGVIESPNTISSPCSDNGEGSDESLPGVMESPITISSPSSSSPSSSSPSSSSSSNKSKISSSDSPPLSESLSPNTISSTSTFCA